jgi:hypothetical protein
MALCVYVFPAIILDASVSGLYFKIKQYYLLSYQLADMHCIEIYCKYLPYAYNI